MPRVLPFWLPVSVVGTWFVVAALACSGFESASMAGGGDSAQWLCSDEGRLRAERLEP